jgi:aerobic C4-dicarboxylate transport protein
MPDVIKKPFYTGLSFQVLVGIAIAIVFGYISPAKAAAMKPLGDGFIRLITMIITLIIFCTVVSGIAGMEDLKKVGRVGGKALLYFEVVSTLALITGLIIGNVVQPGAGFNINPATLDAKAVADYAGQAKAQSVAGGTFFRYCWSHCCSGSPCRLPARGASRWWICSTRSRTRCSEWSTS